MNREQFIKAIRSEIEVSTGCTDPGSISLAVAQAVVYLDCEPESISIFLSKDVYKNAISVGIPGTYQSGIEIAAVLGALIKRPEDRLNILARATPKLIAEAKAQLNRRGGYVKVSYGEAPNPLYVRATVTAGNERVETIISGNYSTITEISKNGVLLKKEEPVEPANWKEACPLLKCTVRELYDFILVQDAADFEFLIEYAERNLSASQIGMDSPYTQLGRFMRERNPSSDGRVLDIVNSAQSATAAAAEARMKGLNVPIVAISGSGNHGIASFLGVLTVANGLQCSREQTAYALAISSMITAYIKGYVMRMTAFCGCGVAAASGVAAAVVYLLGGTFDQSVGAMQSVIGTIGGMFCDGAKLSCAYKLSTAVSTAIQFAYLAKENCYLPKKVGIIGSSIEETFENIGRLNNPGMLETEEIIVSIVDQNHIG